MVAPLVAVINTVSPVLPPTAAIAGVLSDVMLSVDEEPRSDAVTRSGATGVVGAVVSITVDSGVLAAETFPAASVSVAVTDQVPSVSAGRSQEVPVPTM